MTAPRYLAVAAGLLPLLLILSGCVLLPTEPVASPSPSSSPNDSQGNDGEVATDLQAVIVVAGVDVDGKNVTVSSYVAGILENGGRCDYTFSGASGEVSASAEGIADRSVTSCGATQVAIGSFTKGPWEVTMSYTAKSGDVTSSPPVTVEIP